MVHPSTDTNDMKTKTIARNSKRIASIFAGGYTAKAYSLSSSFVGVDTTLEWVAQKYADLPFARLREHENGKITVDVHSNLWFELTPELAHA